MAAKNCADEEAKNRAIEEEIAAKNRAIEEAKNHAIEEIIAAKDRAMEKEITAKNRVVEEEIAAKNRVEKDRNHDIEEEATTKSCAPTEEIKPQDGTPDDQLMMETDGICVPDSNLHQTNGFLEESLPSVTSSVKESTSAEEMMVQAGTPGERLGDENRDQSMMENDDTRVPNSNLDQTDGILEEPSPSQDIETPSVKQDASERSATRESGMVPEVIGDVKEHIIVASSAITENIAGFDSVGDDGMIKNCSVEAVVVGTGNADAQSDERAGGFSSQMIPPVPIDSEETILPDPSNQILVDSSSCIAVVSEIVVETNTICADFGLF